MPHATYRICRFIPSLFEPTQNYDFGVVVSSGDMIVGMGFDVYEAYRLDRPDRQSPFANPMKVVARRMNQILHANNPDSGFKAMQLLESKSPTNLVLSDIQSVEQASDAFTLARDLVKELREQAKALVNDGNEETLTEHFEEQIQAHRTSLGADTYCVA